MKENDPLKIETKAPVDSEVKWYRRDGRVNVLFCFFVILLFADLSHLQPRDESRITAKKSELKVQLKYVSPNMLILAKTKNEASDPYQTSLPASYVPFFFSAMPINSAPKDMLTTVKGVGNVLADEIIRYRESVGPFKGYESLLNLRGVGEKRAKKLSTMFSFIEMP